MSIIEKAMDKLGGQRKAPAKPVYRSDIERSQAALEAAEYAGSREPKAEQAFLAEQHQAAMDQALLRDVHKGVGDGIEHDPGRMLEEHEIAAGPGESGHLEVEPVAGVDSLSNSHASAVQDDASSGGAAVAVAESEEGALIFPGDDQADQADGRFVVEIDFDQLSEAGMISPLAPRSHVAEEFRAIKRPLLMNISNNYAGQIQHPNLIMVTSALQGDGKTFSAINLALSIAMEQDKTVLFVDADVAKATAGRVLGVPEDHSGLIDLLDGTVQDASEVILRTNVPNLRIIPSGNVHDRSTELLASHAMHELMLELSGRYRDRVILFDSPPLLLTSEAGVLANFMGQIAFVVAADETPAGAVTEALVKIGKDKAVGMVLNKAKRASFLFGGRKYGYGYGYGHGYGYGYGRRKESDS